MLQFSKGFVLQLLHKTVKHRSIWDSSEWEGGRFWKNVEEYDTFNRNTLATSFVKFKLKHGFEIKRSLALFLDDF